MFIFLKTKLDAWTHTLSELLKKSEYLGIYLSIKWLFIAALAWICTSFALYDDNPYPLILLIVSMPKIVKNDYQSVRSVWESRA